MLVICSVLNDPALGGLFLLDRDEKSWNQSKVMVEGGGYSAAQGFPHQTKQRADVPKVQSTTVRENFLQGRSTSLCDIQRGSPLSHVATGH